MTLTHGELFAGISGFGLGFDRAGMETKYHVEIDKNCQQLLRDKYPNAIILPDVKEAGASNLPYVDVISFGSPCQDLSIAGKRKGIINGERSNLFFEAIRIVDELKPAFAVWENVPGALSSNSGRDFAVVLSAFRECGACDIAWRILDAQYFGVPQRRRRIFLVADFRGERAAEILFEREGMSGDTPTRRKAGEGIAPVAGTLSATIGNGKTQQLNELDFLVSDLAQITSKQHGSQPSKISQPLNTLGQMAVFDRQRSDEYKKAAETVDTVSARDYKSASDLVAYGIYDEQTPKISENVMPTLRSRENGGGNQQAIAWTERTGKEGGGKGYLEAVDHTFPVGPQGQYFGVRRLTPVECERLQGFPDGWTEGFADTVRYRMLGNAIAVPCAEWIGRRILAS